MSDPSSKGAETVVWWCRHCTEQVGTDGEKPGECPTCGNTEWKRLVSDGGKQPVDGQSQVHSDPQWSLQMDETDKRHFRHGATGYGVEVHGGTPEARETVLREQFDKPVVVVDGRKAESEEDLVKSAVLKMGATEEELADRYSIGGIDLRRALMETENNLVIAEFDSMDRDVQTDVARVMKGVAEDMDMRDSDIMLGYTCAEAGAVVRAERDLSMRIRSWEVTPANDEYDPLAPFEVGDAIKTSARKTPMEVVEVKPNSQSGRKIVVENHHGRYRLRSHGDGSISMRGLNSKSQLISGDVEVSHVE